MIDWKQFQSWFSYWETSTDNLLHVGFVSMVKEQYRKVHQLWWAAWGLQWLAIGVAALLGNPMEYSDGKKIP